MPYKGGYPGGTGLKFIRGRYDFAVDGGAVSSIVISGSDKLPANAIVLGGVLEVDTAVVGSGASVALQVEGAGDIVAAAAVSGAPWSTTGRKSVIPVFTGASSVKTTQARDIVAVISA